MLGGAIHTKLFYVVEFSKCKRITILKLSFPWTIDIFQHVNEERKKERKKKKKAEAELCLAQEKLARNCGRLPLKRH